MDITAVITTVLAMIEKVVPLLTSSAGSQSVIDAILETLIGLLPFIVNEIQALYQPVKNIIDALSASPATAAAQLATLQQLDSQVDTAFAAAASDTDAGV